MTSSDNKPWYKGYVSVINSDSKMLRSITVLKNEKTLNKFMERKPVVYVASHIRFIEFWHKLRASGVTISSTWIDDVPDREDKEAILKLWVNCFEEIRQSDMVLVGAENEDRFKGVLVEIGAALVLDKPVYLIGENNNMGDIYNHPLFHQVSSPEEATTHFVEKYCSKQSV